MKSVVDKFEAIETMLDKKSDKSNELMITGPDSNWHVSAKENVMVSLDDAIRYMITVLVKGDL